MERNGWDYEEREEHDLIKSQKNVKPLNDLKFSGFFEWKRENTFLSLYHFKVIYYQEGWSTPLTWCRCPSFSVV